MAGLLVEGDIPILAARKPGQPPVDLGSSGRPRAAFTLVEVLISISIAALAGSVLLLGTASSLRTTTETLEQTIAEGMAQQLIDEVVGGRYMEFACSPYDVYLAPGGAEQVTGTRELFDDIDDYNGVRSLPPTDLWGIELGKDNGAAGERHPDFRAPPGFFDHWRQEVDVYYVAESNLTARLPVGQVSDYRAVEVRIIYDDPDRGERELARLRRVVAYVPPL